MTDHWFDYFWTCPGIDTPAELDFGQFSFLHLVSLAAMAILVILLVWGYRRSSEARRRIIRLAVGIAALALELLNQAGYILSHTYTAYRLPLHLCAVVTFCVIIDSFKTNSWCREYLYALGTWGPVCALIFADWTLQPWFNIFTWQAFIIHALLLGYILMLLVSREFRPSVRNLWKAVVIMAVFVAISLVINHYWGTNFWFLNTGSPGSPLEPIRAFAGPFYIPVLVVLVAILWTVMYLPWRRAGSDLEMHPSSAVG